MSLSFLHKDQEANEYERPWCMCEKRLQHYVTSLIDTILSVMSGFITEQHISAIVATLYFHC